MQRLKIALLGPPEISLDEAPVETDRHKAIALLAYLAVQPKPQRRDTLAALLWPDYPRTSAFAYLRRTLWELHQMLSKGWVGADREKVWLEQLPDLQVDVTTFEQAISSPQADLEALSSAASLYRGDFLQGLVVADTAPFQEWQLTQAEHYRRGFARLLEKLVETLEQNNDYAQALLYAQRWLALDQLNEPVYRAVMRVLTSLGERNKALMVYQECQATLQNALGVDPQEETRQLYEAILKGERLAGATPAVQAVSWQGNLPTPTTPFIGRKRELEQVLQLMHDPAVRLLTLTGPGGTGKTRLSIEAAAKLGSSYNDGIWFIPLAAVKTLQGLITAMGTSLGFSFYQGEENFNQQLLDYLRHKRMLIILDNFEQLVSTSRAMVVAILQSAPQVKLVVTSRERINLQAEQVYQVGGLHSPDRQAISMSTDPAELAESYEATQLFYERARRVRPGFQPSRENLVDAAHICQMVEGSPLGIELAAAWLEVAPPTDIAREIAHNLDFLESAAGDLPDRQRSLRAVFETSWKLLQTAEQQAFQRLCVFRGSFSRQAAETVCGCSLATLLKLVHQSWLQQRDDGRYQLHEVLRQYGNERLQANQQEWQQTRDRHAEYFAEYLHHYSQALQTSDQLQALEALKLEIDSNIPEALEQLVTTQKTETIVGKMLMGLLHYSMIRSTTEDFIPLLKSAYESISTVDDSKSLVPQAILETVEIYFSMNQMETSSNLKQRTRRLLELANERGMQKQMGMWYTVLVSLYGFNVNFEEGSMQYLRILQNIDEATNLWEAGYGYLDASQFCGVENRELRKSYLEKALAAFKGIGVLHEQGVTLLDLGMLAASEMDYSRAIEYTLEAQGFFEKVENRWGVDRTWMNLADFYIYSGRIEQGIHAFEETRIFNEKSGNRHALGIDLSWESMAVSRYGKLEDALVLRLRSLEVAREVGNPHDIAWHTWELGEIYRLMHELQQARHCYDEALPEFEALNDNLGLAFYERGYGDIATMNQDWSEAKARYTKALEYQEQELRPFRGWGLIYFHTRLSTALVRLGDLQAAVQNLKEALRLVNSWPYPDMMALILAGIAEYLAASGKAAQAIEIATCVMGQPTTWNEVKNQARGLFEKETGSVTQGELQEAQRRGSTAQPDQIIQHYLHNPIFS